MIRGKEIESGTSIYFQCVDKYEFEAESENVTLLI
jgi:hypothetical protein